MSILDMVEGAFGSSALNQIAERVGLPAEQLQSVIGSLAPNLLPKLQQSAVASGDGNSPVAPEPGSDAAEEHGRSVLGSILGSPGEGRSIAQQTATETGVSPDKIEQALPQLTSLLTGAVQSGGQMQDSGGGLGKILSSFEG